MRVAAARVGLLAVVIGSVLACDGEESRPPAPSSPHGGSRDGGVPTSRPPPQQLPPPADDDAGAESDAGGLAIECQDVPAVPFIGEDTVDGNFVNAIDMPDDLLATRVVATWRSDCDPPTLVVELSDGECPDGDGHTLTLELDALEFDTGMVGDACDPSDARPCIKSGANEVIADGGPIRVRYVRPDNVRQTGEYGNCAGSTGDVSFRGEVSLEKNAVLQAQFGLTLTPCDGGSFPDQTILGTFNVELQRGLDDACD